jgi:hypothetical protein
MISAIKVLNTVTALGTDVSVGSDGIVNIASVATVDAYNVRNVTITAPQAEVAGVITITPTSATSAVYTFYINGFSKSTGLPKVVLVSFTSAAAATATTISTQAKAIINADTDFSVAATGTATIVLTGATGFPFFTTGGTSAVVDSYSSAGATDIFTNLSAANGTAGKAAKGTVAALQAKYAYATSGNALTYSDLANLTAGYYYTEVVIDYISTNYSGSGAFKGEISTLEAVVLVRANTTGTYATPGFPALSDFTTTNYGDLLWTYGTITGLAAGYRVVGSALTSAITAGALNSTTQVQTVTGALATVDVVGGDYLVSISTPVISKVLGLLSNTTYVSSNTTVLTSGSFLNLFKWRNLPM